MKESSSSSCCSDMKLKLFVFFVTVGSVLGNFAQNLESDNNELTLTQPQWAALQRIAERLERPISEGWLESRLSKRAPGSMWFGPRLGRRAKRAIGGVFNDGGIHGVDAPRQDLAELLEILQEAPWAVVALNEAHGTAGGHRYTMNFTPRLGRQNSDDAAVVADEAVSEQRAPPFAPRLGRRLTPFSPRLGREPVIDSDSRYTRDIKAEDH